MGIEPTSSAWKAEVLPLNYTCISLDKKIIRHIFKFVKCFFYIFYFLGFMLGTFVFLILLCVITLLLLLSPKKHTRLTIAILAKTFNAN